MRAFFTTQLGGKFYFTSIARVALSFSGNENRAGEKMEIWFGRRIEINVFPRIYSLALVAAVSTASEEFISILAESVEELSKELPKLDILD